MKNKEESALLKAVKSFGFSVLAVILSIFVAVFFVMWAKEYSITQYFSALKDLFSVIWKGSFANKRAFFNTLMFVTPLIFTGVANAIAFKCGLFNIGVSGQFLIGMLAGAVVGLIPGLNPIVHGLLIIIAGIVAGALWAGIPGILKAKVGINEVVNTIMMNYIALYFANWIITKSRFAVPDKSTTPMIQESAKFLKLSNISKANISLFIGIIVAIFIFWLLWKTTIGYEIRGVGLNPLACEYGGVDISKKLILGMVLSGAIAGIGGSTHIAGVLYQCQDMVAVPNFGFDGIAVALLAKNNPIGCIVSAVLFGALNSSATAMQLNHIPKEIVFLIQSIIIIFVSTDYIVEYIRNKRKKGAVINE